MWHAAQIIYKTPSKLSEVTQVDGNLFSIYGNIIENLISEHEKVHLYSGRLILGKMPTFGLLRYRRAAVDIRPLRDVCETSN